MPSGIWWTKFLHRKKYCQILSLNQLNYFQSEERKPLFITPMRLFLRQVAIEIYHILSHYLPPKRQFIIFSTPTRGQPTTDGLDFWLLHRLLTSESCSALYVYMFLRTCKFACQVGKLVGVMLCWEMRCFSINLCFLKQNVQNNGLPRLNVICR